MDVDETPVDNRHNKDMRDIKRSIIIENSFRSTVVFVVAISGERNLNRTLFIPCTGTALTNDVYDSVRDGFVLSGTDYYCLSSIPVSFRISFAESEFEVDIPLPMNIIKRYMSEEDKKDFVTWKSKFKNCSFMTLQMLEVY